jgi:UDP-glucose 4-epimerase
LVNGGTRVLVSGMGSELGSLVATRLEKERWVGEVSGLDIDPPRRRLRSATFHRVEPKDRRRMVTIVKDFDPHVVVHIAVWEPNARAHPGDAAAWTHAAAVGVLGAAAECPSLQHITVRSGISVYGRRRGAATRPDESVPPDPTTPFGRSLLETEGIALQAARVADVPVTALRLAPVIGPHVPSPLGRLLRLPAVPVSLLADPAFSVVDDQDAAAAFVAAAAQRFDGPVNIVSPGAITASQAVRIGGRLPLPLIGPEWRLARILTSALGAPIPQHIHELLHRGRTADGGRALDALDVEPRLTTREVVQALYEWATVIHLRPGELAA